MSSAIPHAHLGVASPPCQPFTRSTLDMIWLCRISETTYLRASPNKTRNIEAIFSIMDLVARGATGIAN